MAELICPHHGPYDASYGSCPYCAGTFNRPPSPAPLSDEDQTDIGAGFHQMGGLRPRWNEGVTDPGAYSPRGGEEFSEPDTNFAKVTPDRDTELENVEQGAQAILWVREGARRGQIYKIQHGTIVARKTGDLMLDDPKVSNPHAKFTVEEKQFHVWDFGSSNGTYVNGERIREAKPLNENDTIKFGDSTFVFKILG